MLPTLSRLSVSYSPESRLRHWCSSRSLRISPLHREFRFPLLHSSPAVSKAIPTLKAGLSLQTYQAAYAPFTPNHSGQRSPPTYYRGCWHVVSRGFLLWYRHFLRPIGQRFTTRRPSSLTRRCWVRLSPISSNVADHPLRSATDRRLGGPLPHQPANQTRAHLPPDCSFDP